MNMPRYPQDFTRASAGGHGSSSKGPDPRFRPSPGTDWRPPALPGRPARRVGRLGCLLVLGGMVVWGLLVFVPLMVVGNLIGPALGTQWEIIPAATGSAPDDPQRISVPVGSRISLSVKEVDRDLRLPNFQPTIQCSIRYGDAAWTALPSRTVPVVLRGAGDETLPLRDVQISSFVTTSADLSVKCVGSEPVRVRREDSGLPIRLAAIKLAIWVTWPVVVTSLLVAGLVVRGHRRRPG